jgi:hypothetical protein
MGFDGGYYLSVSPLLVYHGSFRQYAGRTARAELLPGLLRNPHRDRQHEI